MTFITFIALCFKFKSPVLQNLLYCVCYIGLRSGVNRASRFIFLAKGLTANGHIDIVDSSSYGRSGQGLKLSPLAGLKAERPGAAVQLPFTLATPAHQFDP